METFRSAYFPNNLALGILHDGVAAEIVCSPGTVVAS